MTPLHTAVAPPANDARKSNAQSGLLKATPALAPEAGAADRACQLPVPVRRIDNEAMLTPVPLTTVKLPAPAKTGADDRDKASAASARRLVRMAAIYAEKRSKPR